jgi:hypothetical protein
MPRIVSSLAISIALLLSSTASTDHRIHLVPEFKPGDSLRYQIETQLTSAGTTTTPIVNPEGATQLKQSASILLRLDVLEVHPAANGATGPMRLRATYEKSSATSETDAFDPSSAALVDQYNRLEGRSMDFTVEPDGKLTDIKGLGEMFTNPSAAQTVRSWLAGLSSSAGFPPAGISIGQKWSREQPLTGVPLAGLFWSTEATYLRNEQCPEINPPESSAAPSTANPAATSATNSAAAANSPAPNSEICAVILTQFTIVHRGSRKSQSDATPEDYRRNALRTSGTWTGSGESLDSISLSTGRVVRSTQSTSQDIDFTVTSTTTGSRLTYKGKVQSQSQINLLPSPTK